MAMAVLAPRLMHEVQFLSRQNMTELATTRTTDGDFFNVVVPNGQTIVLTHFDFATSNRANSSFFTVDLLFGGVVIMTFEYSTSALDPPSSFDYTLRGLSFAGDGVDTLQCRVIGKAGSAELTINCQFYTRNTV